MACWPKTPVDWAPVPRPETGDDRALTFSRLRAGPFTVALRAYRSDFSQPVHAHDLALIDLNLAGGGVGRYGRGERESRAGEIEAFAPGVGHSFRSGPRGIRTLHFSVSREDLSAAAGDGLCGMEPCAGFDAASALRPALALLRAARRPADWDADRAEALGWALIGAVFARRGEAGGVSSATPPVWVARALDLLHANLDRPVGLSELADACGVHRGTVARVFLACVGATPGAYHRRLRVAHAARLLARGDGAASVARGAGFADQAHLTRVFSECCAETPGGFVRAIGAVERGTV
jgi:AraC-like DNA-binding protein